LRTRFSWEKPLTAVPKMRNGIMKCKQRIRSKGRLT
jgi:hypothetical protein